MAERNGRRPRQGIPKRKSNPPATQENPSDQDGASENSSERKFKRKKKAGFFRIILGGGLLLGLLFVATILVIHFIKSGFEFKSLDVTNAENRSKIWQTFVFQSKEMRSDAEAKLKRARAMLEQEKNSLEDWLKKRKVKMPDAKEVWANAKKQLAELTSSKGVPTVSVNRPTVKPEATPPSLPEIPVSTEKKDPPLPPKREPDVISQPPVKPEPSKPVETSPEHPRKPLEDGPPEKPKEIPVTPNRPPPELKPKPVQKPIEPVIEPEPETMPEPLPIAKPKPKPPVNDDFVKAKDYYRKGLEIFSKTQSMPGNRQAYLRQAAGNFRQAQNLFERALRREPNNGQIERLQVENNRFLYTCLKMRTIQ
jgi:tetratricopeptide (TPR) repeat protein